MTETEIARGAIVQVMVDIIAERYRQEAKFPEQHLPDGTGSRSYQQDAEVFRARCRIRAEDGTVTWAHVLEEEVYEALAESDPDRLRAELVQVAAVAARWIEDIDRRPPPDRCRHCGRTSHGFACQGTP